ncbi:MAG: extracellular solute-binding protein [Erysipelotrichaceae bacterium]
MIFTLFSACAKPADIIEMKFRITWTDFSGRGVAISKIVDVFNEINKKTIHVTLVSGSEVLDEVKKYIDTDKTEGVVALPYRFLKYFGDRGSIDEAFPDRLTDFSKIYPSLWQYGKVGAKTFGIPWVNSSTCLIYTADLLSKAGVDPASIKNLEALRLALVKVQTKTSAAGIGLVGADHNDVSWMVNQFVYAFGGSLVDAAGLHVNVNSPQAKSAIEYYRNVLGPLAQKNWQNDNGVDVMAKFLNQEVAFEIQGVWGVSDIEKNGNPFKTGIIPLSAIGLYPEMGPLFLSVTKESSASIRTAAQTFIEFMISAKAQEMVMAGEYSPEHESYYPFRMPVRNDLSDSAVFKDLQAYLPFLDGLNVASIDVPVAKWQTIKDTLYAPGLHKVMTGELGIATFLKQIQDQGDQILQAN